MNESTHLPSIMKSFSTEILEAQNTLKEIKLSWVDILLDLDEISTLDPEDSGKALAQLQHQCCVKFGEFFGSEEIVDRL